MVLGGRRAQRHRQHEHLHRQAVAALGPPREPDARLDVGQGETIGDRVKKARPSAPVARVERAALSAA